MGEVTFDRLIAAMVEGRADAEELFAPTEVVAIGRVADALRDSSPREMFALGFTLGFGVGRERSDDELLRAARGGP